jgi:predicted SprT family Zn-dependent metalloprotease
LAAVASEAQVRDVILHEIAHVRVGHAHHHDAVWKEEARRLGATPRATLTDGPSLPAPYVGTCPRGHRMERFRRPPGPVSCAVCASSFRPEYVITWTRREQL